LTSNIIHAYAENHFPKKLRLTFHEAICMSIKAARGTKRVCQSCGSKFYDLNRAPITCPICHAVFQQQEIRGGKAAPAGNAVPVVLAIDGVPSNTVTIAVQ
jgi:hypothetical protein